MVMCADSTVLMLDVCWDSGKRKIEPLYRSCTSVPRSPSNAIISLFPNERPLPARALRYVYIEYIRRKQNSLFDGKHYRNKKEGIVFSEYNN